MLAGGGVCVCGARAKCILEIGELASEVREERLVIAECFLCSGLGGSEGQTSAG